MDEVGGLIVDAVKLELKTEESRHPLLGRSNCTAGPAARLRYPGIGGRDQFVEHDVIFLEQMVQGGEVCSAANVNRCHQVNLYRSLSRSLARIADDCRLQCCWLAGSVSGKPEKFWPF